MGPDLDPGPLRKMWSTPVDLYCERMTPSFWAEPANAISNLAFLFAAFAAFDLWRREGKADRPILALIVVTVAVGLGSFVFHTLATQGAMLFDITPIGLLDRKSTRLNSSH